MDLKNLFSRTILILTMLAHGGIPLRADAPGQVYYSGQLNGANAAYTGTKDVTLSIWGSASGGSSLFSESYSGVVVTNGSFSIPLGSKTTGGIPRSVFQSSPDRWLEIYVAGETPGPRVKLAAAPYALSVSGVNVSNGNVGIGTTAPARKLHVSDSASPVQLLLTGSADDKGGLQMGTLGFLQVPLYASNGYRRLLLSEGIYWDEPNTRFALTNAPYDRAGIQISGGGDLTFHSESADRSAAPYMSQAEWDAQTRMKISHTGQVGIGTTAPNALLELSGSEVTQHGNASGLTLGNTAAGANGNKWSLHTGANGTQTPKGGFSISDNGGYRLAIDNAGRVGIGTTNPTHALELAGGAYSDGSTWVNLSSRASKMDIASLPASRAMQALQDLRPVTFRYKSNQDQKHVGFIAEEVPDLVAMKDRQGLSSMDIVAVLTRVAQEQQKQIDIQMREIEALKRRIDRLSGAR